MTTLTLMTRVTRPGGRGVLIPTGQLPDWDDLTPSDPPCRDMQVALTTRDGETTLVGTERAYRLRDGDWFLPFVTVREPGTIVSATTPEHHHDVALNVPMVDDR